MHVLLYSSFIAEVFPDAGLQMRLCHQAARPIQVVANSRTALKAGSTPRIGATGPRLPRTGFMIDPCKAASKAALASVSLSSHLGRQLCISAYPSTSETTDKGGSSTFIADCNIQSEFVVINAFHLVDLDKPNRVLKEFRAALEGKQVKGRIYISEQGINAQFGGKTDDAIAFAEWVAAQPQFKVNA